MAQQNIISRLAHSQASQSTKYDLIQAMEPRHLAMVWALEASRALRQCTKTFLCVPPLLLYVATCSHAMHDPLCKQAWYSRHWLFLTLTRVLLL
jgi:hypothetical protein